MAADELGLPKSSLVKAIKDLMPAEMRIAGDASDLLVQCCNQFVHLLSTQANAISEREKRSTIVPGDVVRALEELEFGPEYVDAVKAVWDEWKVDNKEHQHQKLVHRKSGLGAAGGLTQQQLIELQHRLFEEARAATLSGPLPSLTLDASGAVQAVAAPDPAAVAPQEQQPLGQQQQQQQQQQQALAAGAEQQQATAEQQPVAAVPAGPAGQEPIAPATVAEEAEDMDGSEDLDDVSDVDEELVGP